MSESPNVVEAVVRVTDALEAAGVDYALSGAVALAYWTTPRATVDVDVAVDVTPESVPDLVATLVGAGCRAEPDAQERAMRGDFGVRCGGVRVDVFLPLLPVSRDLIARRVRVPFGERDVWIASAEDLAVFKLLYGRTKDFADLESLFAARRDKLDFNYLDEQVNAVFRPQDERAARYRRLAALARGS